MADVEESPAICVKGGKGLWLPLGGDAEQDWPQGVRVVLYLLGLFWCFIGVAIIADVFMAAIEKVTSKKIQIKVKDPADPQKEKKVTYEVWNPTVANLTLMALGSSAPEIMLNVIDIFAKEFYLEGLGPSTIVGSAAFNLLMIMAVCVIAIPDNDARTIKEMPVYICTASFSVFAYIWLLIILMGITPNVVDPWEGIVTFLFFPVLCFLAWLADKGYFGGEKMKKTTALADMTADELKDAMDKVRMKHGPDLTDNQVERIMHAEEVKPTSRAVYRVGATRSMFGGKRVKAVNIRKSISMLPFLSSSKVAPAPDVSEARRSTFEFQLQQVAVMENAGFVHVKVIRTGDLSFPARVKYKTKEGKATVGKDFHAAEGTLTFGIREAEKIIPVGIIDDQVTEEDQEFYIVLYDPASDGIAAGRVGLGDKSLITVVIIDNDPAGDFSFEHENMEVAQEAEDYILKVKVLRKQGLNGVVSVLYNTEEDSAKAGRDFVHKSGYLMFDEGEDEKEIELTIMAERLHESKDSFRLFLTEPSGGATLNKFTDGGADKCILTITIKGGVEENTEKLKRFQSNLAVSWDKAKIGHANWAQQFKEALLVNGGEAEDDDEEGDAKPTMRDWAMHLIALPWKLLFALVPPTDYCGGWLCFFCALAMIGVVTIVIGDMASLLGCVMCIPDDITAITFVALGTSLPDLFASKTAAIWDPTADASIGNVTGSNSVNVFLGLGLPWMIAAIYWTLADEEPKWYSRYGMLEGLDSLGAAGPGRKQGFVVQAGSLGFSVTVFSICAVVCIGLLQVRRMFFGGELGGHKVMKWISSFILLQLWVIYIVLSSWKSLAENGSGCAE